MEKKGYHIETPNHSARPKASKDVKAKKTNILSIYRNSLCKGI